jgi:glycosyltransferase involved in cell wall biosynthesis
MIDTLGGGGAEKVLVTILKNLDRTKFDVDLFLIIKEGIYVKEIPPDIICFHIFNDAENIHFLPFKYLYRLFRRSTLELFNIFPRLLYRTSGIKKNYDIAVSFYEGRTTLLFSTNTGHFKKKLAWIHIDMRMHRSVIRSKDIRRCVRECDRIYFVSQGAKEGFIALFPEFKGKQHLEVVYNPIDYQSILKEAEQSLPISKNKPAIVAIGRLTAQKRFDKLLNVHKQLLDEGIDHEVWILGTGENERTLKTQAKQLGITHSCLFLGFRNPYPYLRCADVFVMTSDYEGLPVVVCEAMILAKPIVSTAVTGPNELLESGRYGLLVENTEDAIKKGLSDMLQNEGLRKEYSMRLKNNREKFIFPSDIKEIEYKLASI